MPTPRLALPLCLAALAACAGRSIPNDRPAAAERAVVPSLALDVRHLAEGTTRWSVIMSRDTLTLDLGVMTVATRFVDHGGLPAVLTVRTFPTPRGPIVDSALVLRHTLAPVWQRSHQPNWSSVVASRECRQFRQSAASRISSVTGAAGSRR